MKKIIVLICSTISAAALANDPIWIDVRSPAEYQQGHVANAINIPYQGIAVKIKSVTEDHAAEINVYCGIGVRAQIAKIKLEDAGYTNVHNQGGLADAQAYFAQHQTKSK